MIELAKEIDTGNFGIAVKILDMAFVVVVPSNRLDIVKC